MSCGWLALKAANGLDIPYVCYLKLDIRVLGRIIPGRGVLLVKDSSCTSPTIPGLLGMNVISECYRELFAHPSRTMLGASPFPTV